MSDQPTKITPEDIERKFRALQGDVQDAVDDKKPAVAQHRRRCRVVLLLLVFFLGKRAGKKRSAIVEIRRI